MNKKGKKRDEENKRKCIVNEGTKASFWGKKRKDLS